MTWASRRALVGAGLAALVITARALPVDAADAAPATALVLVDEASAPALRDDGDVPSLRQAIQQSLGWLSRQSPEQPVVVGPRTVTVAEQIAVLRRMLDFLADEPSAAVLEKRASDEFDFLKSVGYDDGTVLATGYHEPIVDVVDAPSAEYRVPIHGVPRDLGTTPGPYFTRAEIEQGWMGRNARTIAWARDPVDVFFMEVEGSGTLRFPDGRELRVGFAATNRRPYRSIARLLIQEGKIARDDMTMRVLREWLAAHPEERSRVLRHNESYVFFRVPSGSPVGSLGVPLTPGRSIATDPRVFPRGALAFVQTTRPVEISGGLIGWKSVGRFVLSQDAGGAIRGPGRVDIFWGRGPEAELAASDMKQPGELYFAVPRAGGAGAPRAPRPGCCETAGAPPPPIADREVETPPLPDEPRWSAETPPQAEPPPPPPTELFHF